MTVFPKLVSEIDDVFGGEKIVKHGLPVELFHSHLGRLSAFKKLNKNNIKYKNSNFFHNCALCFGY